jgi:hypothetical protein
MTDLHEMAKEHKRSDTSLMNFMQNHRVSVCYDGKHWVATTGRFCGHAKSLRLSISNLKNMMDAQGE